MLFIFIRLAIHLSIEDRVGRPEKIRKNRSKKDRPEENATLTLLHNMLLWGTMIFDAIFVTFCP